MVHFYKQSSDFWLVSSVLSQEFKFINFAGKLQFDNNGICIIKDIVKNSSLKVKFELNDSRDDINVVVKYYAYETDMFIPEAIKNIFTGETKIIKNEP